MQNQNFKKDDGLYELLNVNDNFEEDINTSRTDDMLFNSNPIDWHKKIYLQKSCLSKCYLNGNNSSVALSEYDLSVSRALENNAISNLPISCKKETVSLEDNISIDLTPRSQIFNKKALQNIDKLLPQSFKSKLNCSTDFILCPECKMNNLSDLDWCLSCGLFLIKKIKPNYTTSNKQNSIENVTKSSTVNTELPMTIKDKENFSKCIENSDEFDRLYKRSLDNVNNYVTNSDENNLQSINSNKSVSVHVNDEIKLNLSELESYVTENKVQMSKFDLDIDIIDPKLSKMNDTRISPKLPSIPLLDLSTLESNRDHLKTEMKLITNNANGSKENSKKPHRRWASSSMCWEDKPDSLLKKKPSKFYRNQLNSCTTKIGIHVYPSKIDNGRICLSDDAMNNNYKINNSNEVENFKFNTNATEKVVYYVKEQSKKIVDQLDISEFSILNDVVDKSDHWNKNNSNISDLIVNINSSNPWQCLPAEIWIKIMAYLSHFDLNKLQQTCRRIYSIGLDSQLWRCVTLFRHNNLTDNDIINIAHKMPRELHFKNCLGTSITFNGLKEMFHICGSGVEKLSFISCSKGALEGDQFLVLSAAFCPNVTHINASYLMNLQDSTLISMTEGFNRIESLNLMGAHSISNESIRSLIKNHRSSLTSLDLYGCFRLNSGTLRLLEECLNLKSLALGSINKLKRVSMVELLKKLSQLTNLDLRGTMNLIDDKLLAQICILCPNLQQIILTNSCLVGNEGLTSLANSNVSKTLKVLDICGCSRINDKGVEAILKNCQNLEDLDISCTGITGRITKLFNIYPPMSLKCLRVNNNKLISETELASIVKSSKKLTTVYMCGITSIDTWRSLETNYQHILFKHE